MDPIKRLLACALVALAAPCAWAHSPAAPGSPHAVPAALPTSPLSFEENKGQVRTTDGAAAPDVRYRLSQGNTQLFLLENGIAYQFSRTHYPEGYAELAADARHDHQKQAQLDAMRELIRLETFRMDMRLEGASTNARITTGGRSSDYTQYYNHDALDVHSYTKVTYHDIYPGIDWVVYTTEKGMKYDFVVRPGADPDRIRLRFEHHEELTIDADGNLIHGNRMGRFTEERPVSFQEGKEVPTSFVLERNMLRFALENYDQNRTLTIDPARIWGTYYGDVSDDFGHSSSTDANNNVYLAGSTLSVSAIAAVGHQNTSGGLMDAFLVKFNSAGQRLWGTYYGGPGTDNGRACAVDGSGNVYLAGATNSITDIASGGHQNMTGGDNDAFLVKFDSDGIHLWSTYYGGLATDYGLSCTVGVNDDVFLAGTTFGSLTGIASGGHQNAHGGNDDAFLVKFSSAGVRQWGTYYGGAQAETQTTCATDASGNVFLAGSTGSTTNIGDGGHQNTPVGLVDCYLVKFNSAGQRQWGTYYGGLFDENGGTCVVDNAGNVYLSGSTTSYSGIATPGSHQDYHGAEIPAYQEGFDYDAFLAKFDNDGVRLWATYYGGWDPETGRGCTTDGNNNVYLTGETRSEENIGSGGHQNTYAGSWDAFLVQFNESGERQWGTYYGDGGAFDDWGIGCAVDSNNDVYIAGQTGSPTAIASGGHQNMHGGNQWDAFLVKFEGGAHTLSTGTITDPLCVEGTVDVPYTAEGTFNAGNIFTAELSDDAGSFASPVEIGSVNSTTSGTINATVPGGTLSGAAYRIRVVSSDPMVEGDDNGADITVQAAGDVCDDNDPNTEDDILDEDCQCAGEPLAPEMVGYRYWFEDDIANATTIAVAPVPELLITDAFDAQDLDGGLRRVSVQAQDNMGYWSSPQTSLFARVDAVVSGYRYWVNDDPSNMATGTVTPAGVVDLSAALPISGADRPFNLITIQFLDPAGVYSAPLTKAFALTHGLVSGYRYWVNDDPSTMQTVSVTPVELLDLTSPLAIGIADRSFNILTIQFRDQGGIFSVPYTTTFVRSTGPIVEYEYWIDDVIADRVAGGIGPAEVADLIDDLPTSAPPGPHVFTIRFRGESGAWSVPLTNAFISNMEVYDCPALEANIGDACDPSPGFENGEVNAQCECVGDPIIVFDCPELEANIGDACDPGPGFENGEVTAECECVGDPIIVFDCPELEANIGDECDPGPGFENGEVTEACTCEGTPIIIYDCPELEANIGDPCDPGPGFINGVVTEACECLGEPADCVHDVVIDFATDGNGGDISWTISPLAGGAPVCSGNGLPSNQPSVLEACCLPDGCYRLVVTDAGGDGISAGGYILRMLSGERIIDNRDNGTFGSESSLADGDGFCLPLGTDRPIATSCDRAYWISGNFLVATENDAVSNVWNTTTVGDPLRANSGYEFWFFDPNGTDDYSFRKLRTHAVSDGFGNVGATRACHIQLNNWAASQHLQDQVLYNVRIRGVVNGVALSEYGPACRATLDPVLATCPPTKLNDVVGHPNYSCGVTRTFGGPNTLANRLYAMAIAGANQYEFEFSNAAEGYLFSRFSNNVQRHLNWPATVGPALEVSATYQVRVRARKGAIWCAWGDPCDVTIIASAAPGTESMIMEENLATLTLWPNPNSGDQFWLQLDAIEEGVHVVNLDIMDLTGKRVNARVLPVTDRNLNTVIDLNGDLATGMYMVHITTGAKRWTERLVIAK